jgi:hypothetical protein
VEDHEKDVVYFLQVSTREFEYADSARSFIGFQNSPRLHGTTTTVTGKK